jgi:hypothetical protein
MTLVFERKFWTGSADLPPIQQISRANGNGMHRNFDLSFTSLQQRKNEIIRGKDQETETV